MGGHGGLNILPQKRWNVYNYENREKVRQDEEAAAKEEQLKRDQSRKRDAEFRLEQLRQARGLAPTAPSSADVETTKLVSTPEPESKSKFNHINLFDGIKIFDPIKGDDGERGAFKKMKVAKKEAEPRVVLPEDEKYRLGYGIAGKGVKLPWYLSRPDDGGLRKKDDDEEEDDDNTFIAKEGAKGSGKKTLEQLREERLKREKKEKERERALILEKRRRDGPVYKDRRSSRR